MRVPVEWLRELVSVEPGLRGHDIAASLVKVGLEEEALFGGEITGPLVVGRVLSQVPEPQKNGKTVHWCHVDVGANGQQVRDGIPQEIVCGAHNFDAGDWVVCILPGGVLPGGFAISARKTYGHVSNGMICSERELGLGDNHDGILVLGDYFADRPDVLASLTPGMDAIALLGLDREVIEVNVTPDRGYCFSMRGVAREYALATGAAYDDPASLIAPTATPDGYAVRLADATPLGGAAGCDRYVARIVRSVDANASSPAWMRQRLTEVGMRPISLAVDVTNYVMMLLGQPLHAFDLDRLSGSIEVRRARAGERLTTLDGVERTLSPQDLLITDGGEVPLAIAGVMGGEPSEVTATTRNVLIEAAHFDPVTVARSSRRHRLITEASKRYERGVDPALAGVAAQLAAHLLVEHGGGRLDDAVTDEGQPLSPAPFDFDVTLPTRLVGLEYPRGEVLATLRALGCALVERGGDFVEVTPPSWRPDLTDGPELVEEVARVRGFDHIPAVVPRFEGPGLTHGQRSRRIVAATLAAGGLVEVLSYPFVSPDLFDRLSYPGDDERRRTVALANPLQDEAPLMRTSLLDTMLETLRRNLSRGSKDVAIFEMGLVTLGEVPTGGAPIPAMGERPSDAQIAAMTAAVPPQPRHVAFAASGLATPAGPWGSARAFDTTDAVAWARIVGACLGLDLVVAADAVAPWHPGRCARLTLQDGTRVGHVGELHPKVLAALELPARTVAGELDLDVLAAASEPRTQARRLSAFPVATTDVALTVAPDVAVAEVERALRAGAGEYLDDLALFDIYRGDQLGSDLKSLAFRLTFRADRTLTTEEVSRLRDQAVAAAAAATGARQRT